VKKKSRWEAIEPEPTTPVVAEGGAAAKAARKLQGRRDEQSNACPYCHAVNDAIAQRCRHCQRRLSRAAEAKAIEDEQTKSGAAFRADDDTEISPV
jgi:hypothetical protein